MEFLDHDLLAGLANIPLEARQGMSGFVSGRHRSVHRGSSVEFAEYRKYVPGDDTKRLDWKAFARSDKYFVKEFEADTNMRVYMLLDASGSMGFSFDDSESKYLRACRLIANIAYLAIAQGDAVGMFFSKSGQGGKNQNREGAYFIPPSRRPAQVRLLLHQMALCRSGGATTLVENMHELAERVPRRGLVIVCSDLFVDAKELKEALRHLKFLKHDIAVFHFMDDVEMNLTINRPVRFVDMEGETSIVSEPALVRKEYKEVVKNYMLEVKQACFDVDADYFILKNTDSWQEAVTRFLMGRVKKKK